ncbi:hypothetical protein CRJUMX02_1180008 [Escherichia coli]|nr:hypothetical protein CRJUMX02_1180008 [Escherichia coli]
MTKHAHTPLELIHKTSLLANPIDP